MPINFSETVYLACFDTFARLVNVTPQTGAPYDIRGILDTRDIDVVALDGSIISEQRTILDLRDEECPTPLPRQGDQVTIPADDTLPAEGTFEIIDSARNGGGETTLTLRKVMTAKPSLKVVTR